MTGGPYTTDQWQRIDQIFQEIVELPETERDERLRQLTQDDTSIRVEVESLLEYDDADSNLPAVRSSEVANVVPEQQAGHEVAERYRLLFPLAINRHSEVWCGEETQNDSAQEASRVAIKFLRDVSASADAAKRRMDRFRQEAILLSRFKHPNVAELIDCGQTETGIPYIVTRYIAGASITEFADSKHLGVRERLQLMIRVCDAVSYAHRFLVVHRDLKPSNILVQSTQEPVILDFGISKTLRRETDAETNSSDANSLQLTTTNERPMTPAWASPEQVHGDPVTTVTDQYALGLILYELLTGHHPYADEAHEAEAKLLDRVCRSIPRRPSEIVSQTSTGLIADDQTTPKAPRMIAALRSVAPRQLKRQLRGSLDSVVLRAIAKQPTDRYASLADFRNDLQNVIDGRPVSARLQHDRFRNVVRRHPLTAITSAILATATFVALGVFSYSRGRVQELTEELGRTRETLTATQTESQQRIEKLNESVAALDTSEYVLRMASSGKATGETATTATSAAFAARQLAGDGNFERATELLTSLSTGSFGELPMHARLDAAAAWQLLGRPTAALHWLEEAPTDNQKALADEFVRLRIRLLLDAGKPMSAEHLVEENSDALDDAVGSLLIAEVRHAIGWNDGAQELLSQLKPASIARKLSVEERMQAELLLARTTDDQELFDRILTMQSHTTRSRLVKSRALLSLGELHRERKETDAAQNCFRGVIASLVDGPENHLLELSALSRLADVAEKQGDEVASKQWREKLWKKIQSTGEYGTVAAAWCAVLRTHNDRSDEEVAQLISTVEKYHPDLAGEPYLERLLMAADFRLAVRQDKPERALAKANRLCEIESVLWGDESLEFTYALATRVWASRQLGIDVQEDVNRLVTIVLKLRKSLPRQPALAFLTQASNLQSGIPAYEWIHRYQMHRFNEVADQRGMVEFIARELTSDHPADAELLVRQLELLDSE